MISEIASFRQVALRNADHHGRGSWGKASPWNYWGTLYTSSPKFSICLYKKFLPFSEIMNHESSQRLVKWERDIFHSRTSVPHFTFQDVFGRIPTRFLLLLCGPGIRSDATWEHKLLEISWVRTFTSAIGFHGQSPPHFRSTSSLFTCRPTEFIFMAS